jgi:soluble cytochrome b562
MKREVLTRILAMLIVGVLFSTVVAAQPSGTVLDSLTKMLGGESLPDFYDAYYQWIDLIVYIFLFVFIAKSSLGKMVKDQGYHSKLPVVLGVVLAVSAALFESQVGFRLSNFGPIALGILFAVLGFAIFQFISGSGFAGRSTWAFAYVIAYGFMAAAAPQYYVWLQLNAWFLFLSSLLDILFIVALGVILFAVFGFVTGRGGGHDAAHRTAADEARVAHDERAEFTILRDLVDLEAGDLRELAQLQRIVREANNILANHASELRNSQVYDRFLEIVRNARHTLNNVFEGDEHHHHLEQLMQAYEQRLRDEYRVLVDALTRQREADSGLSAGDHPIVQDRIVQHIDGQIAHNRRRQQRAVSSHPQMNAFRHALAVLRSGLDDAIGHIQSRRFNEAREALRRVGDTVPDAITLLESLAHLNIEDARAVRSDITSPTVNPAIIYDSIKRHGA